MIASLETLKCVCSTANKDLVERNIDQVLTGVMFGVNQGEEETVIKGLEVKVGNIIFMPTIDTFFIKHSI